MAIRHHSGLGGTRRGGHPFGAAAGVWHDGHGRARTWRSEGLDRLFAVRPGATGQDGRCGPIDRLGWDGQSPDGRYQHDRYDADDTLSLIVWQAETGRQLGSVRLLPSTRPHLLHDSFAHLCADTVPVADDIWEITRFVTAPGLDWNEALQVRRQLAVALFEHGLGAGISRYTMVTQLPWLPGLLGIGWDAEPLGLPHGEGRDAVAALSIRVNRCTLARLRAAWNLPDAVPPLLAN